MTKVGLASVLVVTACAGHTNENHIDASPPPPSIDAEAVNKTVVLGVYANQDGMFPDAFPDLETAIGRNLAIENQREIWAAMFMKNDERADLDGGVIPMISWTVEAGGGDCAKPADIMAGVYDAQLATQAQLVASWAVPVVIRFYKEFTDSQIDVCFYGEGHPGKNAAVDGPKLVGAWRHIVDVFKHNGATNVQWVWGPSANLFSMPDGTLDDKTWKSFYPGDAYVDWIANDNYNKDTSPAAYDQDPDILNWYGAMSVLGKPLMQSETGAGFIGSDPEPQTAWITSAQLSIETRFPAIKAFVYWDAQGQQDYRIQGSGLDAFTAMAADPYFGATDITGYFSSTGTP
jgi:endoglucanase